MKLTLASASPRRLDLLAQIGVVPDAVTPADIDETPLKAELPRVYAGRLAREKALAVQAEGLVLAADTVVAVGRRILEKPVDAPEAERFLRLLSGRRHRVITGVALRHGDHLTTKQVETAVRFKHMNDSQIAAYIASNEWQGKAGGYGIQGLASAYIPWINGSYSNVVGLPLAEVANMLTSAGYRR